MSIYGWIWRHLPGGRRQKVLWAALLIAVVVGALVTLVFPRIDWLVPFSSVTVAR